MKQNNNLNMQEMIHSLRNPLTAIISNLKMIKTGYSDNISLELKDLIEELIFDSEYMEILMKNASDIIKIKDKNDLHFFQVNLNELVNQILNQISVIYQNYKELIDIRLLKSNIVLNIDTEMLQRFLIVLIIELLKFSSEENKILINFDIVDNNVVGKIKISNFDKKIFDSHKIFSELFVNSGQKSNRLNSTFYNKFLKLHNGGIESLKEGNQDVLKIWFAQDNI